MASGEQAGPGACPSPAAGLTVLASRHYANDARLAGFLAGKSGGGGGELRLRTQDRADRGGRWPIVYPRFGRTMEWDTAGPQAVLEAAGGRLLDLDGQTARLRQAGVGEPAFRLLGPVTRRLQPGDPAAASLLLQGGLVAFPTETVYGLGADATSNTAVAAIYTAKGRPHFNPLICHYPDADAAFRHVDGQRRWRCSWPQRSGRAR